MLNVIQKIKIDIDVKNKRVNSMEWPDGIDPVERVKILLGCANGILEMLKVEEKREDIIVPDKKIVTPKG